ncbi:MAG TPA: MFS transporter [Natronosporangium sp.]
MRAATAHATALAAVGVLPAFLVGALAIQLRAELGVQVAALGIATAGLFITTALLARFGARVVRRAGTGWAMAIAPVLSAVALGIGAAAPNFATLALAMVLGGAGNAIAQPVVNQRLADFVADRWLGTAVGLKQASVPAAALLAGLAVPVVAIVLGWRWVLAMAAVLAGGVALVGFRVRGAVPPAHLAAGGTDRRGRLSRRTLLLITAGGFLASTVGTSVGVFFVDSAVATGFSPGAAGSLYAGLSVVGIVTRVGLGWLGDRRPGLDSYLLVSGLLGIGVVGCLLLALGGPVGFVAGAVLSYTFGWAWPGVVHYAVTRDNRAGVAAATGVLQSGSSLGAGVGPLFFGFLVGATSYRSGWLTAAVLGAGAATLMALGARSARQAG